MDASDACTATEHAQRLLEATVDKWEHEKERVAALPWSQVPPQMLRDFLLATSAVVASHGKPHKSEEILACALLENNTSPATLNLDFSAAGERFILRARLHRHGVALPVIAPQPLLVSVCDPYRDLDDESLVRLTREMEGLVSVPARPSSQEAVLVGACAFLDAWKYMAATSQQEAGTKISGLRNKDGLLPFMLDNDFLFYMYRMPSAPVSAPEAEESPPRRPRP